MFLLPLPIFGFIIFFLFFLNLGKLIFLKFLKNLLNFNLSLQILIVLRSDSINLF